MEWKTIAKNKNIAAHPRNIKKKKGRKSPN